MASISLETVPLFVAMTVVVPLTFEAVRYVIEDCMDLDVILGMPILRAAEFILSVMLFPSAFFIMVILSLVYVVKKILKYSVRIVNFLYRSRFLKTTTYLITVLFIFFLLNVTVVYVLKLAHAKLTEK